MSEITENCNKAFNDFISHLQEMFIESDTLINIVNEPTDKKLERLDKFNKSISSITNFNYLLKNKIKLFSHKDKDTQSISESLFGSELTLKKIFNNQDEIVKSLFWSDLQNLLLIYNEYLLVNDPNNDKIQERINKIKDNLQSKAIESTKQNISNLLNTSKLNSSTNNLLEDIFSNFEQGIKNEDNPLTNIVDISKKITEKYQSQIENGDINLNDILANMKNLPGMEKVGNIMNMFGNMPGINPTNNEPVIIDENFSTAVIETGKVPENDMNLNIGSLLQGMNSLSDTGLLNGPMNELGGIKDMLGNLGNLNLENLNLDKLMGVFNKVNNIDNKEEMENIFKDELGVDVSKILG